MRMSDHTRKIVRDCAAEIFGPDARVRLFGSRTDDSARGGDIDLLIELPHQDTDANRKALKLTARLQRRLGDQRIDVLVIDPTTPRQPIHREAMLTGVRL